MRATESVGADTWQQLNLLPTSSEAVHSKKTLVGERDICQPDWKKKACPMASSYAEMRPAGQRF